ncbi:MAG: exonuclease SbcCD subunit D [Clostridiales bacterium]|jgi:exonuclease SbcD|nr:exonuclease SbcCD subunit D [Clostridiales bacterium]
MFRLLHTSDWHLGKTIYGRSLLPDQEYFVNQVFLPTVRQEHPDCVILAGDIYDRQIAPVEAIRLFDRVIDALSEEGVPLLAVTGNHDGPDRVAVGASLLKKQGITIHNRPEQAAFPVKFHKDGRRIHFYPLPYFDLEQARGLYPDAEIKSVHDAYSAVLEPIKQALDPEAVNILIAHCFVAGSMVCDSENPLSVGGSAQVGAGLFDGFDYVALGHLHSPQRAGGLGRYSGSPLKYSFDEARRHKSMTIVEIDDKITQRLLPVTPLRDMREIRGSFSHLLSMGKEQPSDDYLYAILTDQNPVYLPMDQLRVYYPNLMGLRSEWALKGLGSTEQAAQHSRKSQTDLEIFDAFLQQICELDPSPADETVFRQACDREQKEEQ